MLRHKGKDQHKHKNITLMSICMDDEKLLEKCKTFVLRLKTEKILNQLL